MTFELAAVQKERIAKGACEEVSVKTTTRILFNDHYYLSCMKGKHKGCIVYAWKEGFSLAGTTFGHA